MKDELTSYKFECAVCGEKTSVEVRGIWRSRDAVKPKGWAMRVVGLFYRSFCPDCKGK